MSKAARDPELAPVLAGQFDGHMVSKTWTADAHVDRHIKHAPPQHGDQLALRLRILQMQAAQHALSRTRHIILQKRSLDAGFCIAFGLKRLKEEATLVAKHLWLNNKNFRDGRWRNLHDDPSLVSSVEL